jgi:hypothetical protein
MQLKDSLSLSLSLQHPGFCAKLTPMEKCIMEPKDYCHLITIGKFNISVWNNYFSLEDFHVGEKQNGMF